NGNDTIAWNLSGMSAGVITTSGAATTLTTQNTADSTFAGTIAGGLGLTVSGTGGTKLTLTGANTYTGATAIGSGQTLQIAAGGPTGSITRSVTFNSAAATLAFNRSDSMTYAGALSGAGALQQNGPATLTLSGNNGGYSGTATINAGTLTLGSANALGTGAVTFAGNNTVLEATTSSTVSGSSININPGVSATFGATTGNTLTLASTVIHLTAPAP